MVKTRAATTKEQYMLRAASISLWFNIVLFIFKLTALIVVHSLAIATDFAITVVGLTVSVILYNSLKLSVRPADLLHNYGYGKVEHVCEAMEGIVLIGIAAIMSFQAFATFFHPSHVTFPWIGFASSMLSLTLNFVGAFFIFQLARKSSSPAVRAEGVHYTLEGFISTAIACAFMVTILLKNSAYEHIAPYIDPAVTMLVSFAISLPSIKLARQAFVNLLDISIEEPGKMEIVVRLARHADYYCNFEDLKTRTAGHKKFIEVKIVMPKDMPFFKAHEVVSKIERDIAQGVPDSEVTVIMMPCLKNCGWLQNNKPCPYLSSGSV
ncbi:MAG TPA: cation diffusion facilitator family transporter [Candidatus Omnitrophota bacterium]|nr:cation diffusion facilitator family transporter [Candidatus Omnitrophota bacterium]HPD85390.1 cation diffusion facilitator family transporter [Candidatus Omnitrophota bacterium]HRZ04109.1 cation diffusion facilitator family transporter [Candidatus Omnitrophota bacterium]